MMRRSGKSDRFLKSLKGYVKAIVVTHDTPDPDAIGSGWALLTIIEQRLSIPVRMVAGGAIVRAENRRMMELLRPPIELLDRLDTDRDTALVFVDCLPQAASHLLSAGDYSIVAVIDHHDLPKGLRVPYLDIRPNVIAAGTIATQYLCEQRIEPSADLATALIYAIQTDARSPAISPSRADKSAVSWLVQRADLQKLAEITNAPLEPSYFMDLALAIEHTTCYGDAALCFLPTAHGPEVVGEFADLLIRCRTIERIMCAAMFDGDLLISVRTTRQGGDACALVRKALLGIGAGGGHQHRAGGKIPAPLDRFKTPADLQAELCRRWLTACGVLQESGVRLVPSPCQ
jgi:nanoRNase/pAp phosphatase (c-di-AMP/oligoRNAs hydrolase)